MIFIEVLAYIKLLQKASTKRDVKEKVHSLTHQDHPQPDPSSRQERCEESHKLQTRLPYHRTRLDRILHTRPPLGYRRSCKRLKLPIYRDI
jgi:hypothetical protein